MTQVEIKIELVLSFAAIRKRDRINTQHQDFHGKLVHTYVQFAEHWSPSCHNQHRNEGNIWTRKPDSLQCYWLGNLSPHNQHTFQPGDVENIVGYFPFESSKVVMFTQIKTWHQSFQPNLVHHSIGMEGYWYWSLKTGTNTQAWLIWDRAMLFSAIEIGDLPFTT